MDAVPRFLIRSITIQPEGVALEFMDADHDVRASGMQLQHVLFVPEGDDYDDEIETLVQAAHALLVDGLEDYGNTPALKLSDIAKAAAEREAAGEDDDEDEAPEGGDPSYYDLPSR